MAKTDDLTTRAAFEKFVVPDALIAQAPAVPRDSSRLMVLHRATGEIEHRVFRELPEILAAQPAEYSLVLNNSRVRDCLLEVKDDAGTVHVIYLLEAAGPRSWKVSGEPVAALAGKRVTPVADEAARCAGVLSAPGADGMSTIEFTVTEARAEGAAAAATAAAVDAAATAAYIEGFLRIPLPPYVTSRVGEEGYQTVYASPLGSVAAPTAGLHFTEEVLEKIKADGGTVDEVTLHVGYGTFGHIEVDSLTDHNMHPERVVVGQATADRLAGHVANGRTLLAVGTTSTRTLETCARDGGKFEAMDGTADLFIYPGYEWKAVGALLTNFHMPGLTPVCLVAAFAGYDLTMKAYQIAVEKEYRFFSFGDSMLVVE